MLGCSTYISLNGTDERLFQDRNQVPEMKMGHPARQPILKWLDLLAQVAADRLLEKGKKPWRRYIPDRPGIQMENRRLGLMTRKALTALAEPCLPADRLSVSAALVAETGRRMAVQAKERIGGRRRLPASAPA